MNKSLLTIFLILSSASTALSGTYATYHHGAWDNNGGSYSGIYFNLGETKNNTVNISTKYKADKDSAIKTLPEAPKGEFYLQSITLNGREGRDEYLNSFDNIDVILVLDDKFDLLVHKIDSKDFNITKNIDKKSSKLTINFSGWAFNPHSIYKLDFYDKDKRLIPVQLHCTSVSADNKNTPITGFRNQNHPSSNGILNSGIKIIYTDSQTED